MRVLTRVLLLIGLAGFCSDCGLQGIPRHQYVPFPAGKNVELVCRERPPPRALDDAPMDFLHLEQWAASGAFVTDQPVRHSAIQARHAQLGWTADQRKTFPHDLPEARASAAVPIGGSYWWNIDYIVARPKTAWVSSRFAASNGAYPRERPEPLKGSLRSPPFTITKRFIRVELGGDDIPEVGFELLVRATRDELVGCDTRQVGPRSQPYRDAAGEYVPVFVRRGRGHDTLEPDEIELVTSSCNLLGKQAIVRIFDESNSGHINVGAITPTDVALDASAKRGPVWGFADFHTHPTNYLGMGGLHGIHTVWGAPGGRITKYVPERSREAQKNLAHDIPPCDDVHETINAHHGGYAAPIMLNVAEGRTSDDFGDLMTLGNRHSPQGGPSFTEFPDFRHGAHQQHHITQMHRAYLGGLRLISALAVHNRGLEYGMGWVVCGGDGRPAVDTTTDQAVVRAHVQAMRELASLNKEWMAIAYTPEQARDIIRSNRLAVVLGIEVPQLGEFDEKSRSVPDHVSELVNLGIRQVVIVHGMDNELGGAALFNDLYNTVGDWMNRRPKDRHQVQALSGTLTVEAFGPAAFFEVTTDPSPLGSGDDPILFRLANPRRMVLSNVFPRPDPRTFKAPLGDLPYGALHPFVNAAPLVATERGVYDGHSVGHRNKRGLSGRGEEFLLELVRRGMIVDFAHMSDATVAGSLAALNKKSCDTYPFLISHAHFRHLPFNVDYSDRTAGMVRRTRARLKNGPSMSDCVHDNKKCDPQVLEEARLAREKALWQGPGSLSRGNLPREYDISTAEVETLTDRGGAVGVFLGHGPLDDSKLAKGPNGEPTISFTNDCAGSSKGFAVSLRFAGEKMRSAGVPRGVIGIASDFTMIKNTTPRFGSHACSAYEDVGAGSASGAQLLEVLLNPEQYRFNAQTDPVMYTTGVKTCAESEPTRHSFNNTERQVACGANAPLDPYVMGERIFDFNVDGLAHIGMVPDMLQDVANVLGSDGNRRDGGHTNEDLDRVFHSADGYISMWERAQELVQCDRTGVCAGADAPLKDSESPGRWCGDGCPDSSWNGGAPLQSVGSIHRDCEYEAEIRFPIFDEEGQFVRDLPPKYYQHASQPEQRTSKDGTTFLKYQGDWAVYPIQTRQLWTCGRKYQDGGKLRTLGCPPEASYVKVRRVLDASLGDTQNCEWLALPPTVGNRDVLFECLVGPPDRREITEAVNAVKGKR